MIKKITITNYLNESIEIDLRCPEKSGLLIYNITGLGPVKADINSTELSTYDGSIFNSARANSRNIVISMIFLEKNTIEETRHLTYKYFPLKKNLKIVIETDTRICETTGYVESNEPSIFSSMEGTQISIVCPDSFFYSSGNSGINITYFYAVEPLFEFPFSNESLSDYLIEFAAIHRESVKSIYYTGDSEIGFSIEIHAIGTAKNVTVINTKTRESMKIDTDKLQKLTGNGIIDGDTIYISTMKGEKTITLLREGIYTNILNCLDKNADWFQLSKGDNIFTYTADEGLANLQISMQNRTIYEGI